MNVVYWLQYLPLTFNLTLAVMFFMQGEMGKTFYWGGCTILTIGVILMEG